MEESRIASFLVLVKQNAGGGWRQGRLQYVERVQTMRASEVRCGRSANLWNDSRTGDVDLFLFGRRSGFGGACLTPPGSRRVNWAVGLLL